MKHYLTLTVLFLVVACVSGDANAKLGERPPLPDGVPDLTKGEGPTAAEVGRGKWYLHASRTRGWMYLDEKGKGDKGRQILITEVPATSSLRHDLKVGDVILGVNGKYFSGHAVFEFRRTSLPANRTGGKFKVIMWRKGWDKEREVELSTAFLPVDLTKGEKRDQANDWNLGPTGARGWMQGRTGQSLITRQILITSVAKGSPADGILEEGDVILGVEGKKFSYDARRAFVEAINRAETKKGGGKFSVVRWRDGKTEDVTIQLRVMGSYSETRPWNCEKSEKILEEAIAYLLKNNEMNKYPLMNGRGNIAALALMATGEKEHLEMARERMYKLAELIDNAEKYPPQWSYPAWGWSYATLAMAEYHLLTGDKKVLPAIERLAVLMAEGQSGVGSWGHRFAAEGHGHNPGYGALNQSGTICWMALITRVWQPLRSSASWSARALMTVASMPM